MHYMCYIVICRCMQNTYWRNDKDERRLLLKYTSHFIWKVCVWERVGDRTELQYINPHSYSHQRCVFLLLLMLNRRPEGPAFCWVLFSLAHLVTNGSGLQTHRLPIFTELYKSSITHSISLKWHVWSSSTGINCHAVHRSLSSGASVYDCTMGFYLVPYCQPSLPTRFLPITDTGMCHFLPVHVWNGMFGRVEGQYTTHEH